MNLSILRTYVKRFQIQPKFPLTLCQIYNNQFKSLNNFSLILFNNVQNNKEIQQEI